MIIQFNAQEIEILEFEIEDGGYLILEAYNHTLERELTELEMDSVAENARDQIYEKRSHGTGY